MYVLSSLIIVTLATVLPIVTSQVLREILRDDFDASDRQPSSLRWNVIGDFAIDEKRYIAEVKDVYVEDGSLRLSVNSNSTSYIMVDTSGKFRFRYGEVEVRLRAPHGISLVSSVALISDRCSLLHCTNSIDDNYPRIYVTELSSSSPPNQSSVRSEYYIKFDNHSVKANVAYNPALPGQNLFSEFHVYRMVWKKDSLTWFIDGQKVFETTNKDAVPDIPMRLQISLSVSADEVTVFPATFEIDYIVIREESPYTEPDLLFSADFSSLQPRKVSAFLRDSFTYGIVDNTFTPLPGDSLKIANGSLQLSCYNGLRQNNTHGMTLQTHFDFLYGELQFRARFPTVQDGPSYGVIGLRNYLCGSAECRPHDNTPEASLGQKPGSPTGNYAEVAYTEPLATDVQRYTAEISQKLDLSAASHKYRLLWTPSSLRWFVNDNSVFVVTDAEKVPKIRMHIYFTLFCDSTKSINANLTTEIGRLTIESIKVRQWNSLAEVAQPSASEGWEYAVLFGILGTVLFVCCVSVTLYFKRWRDSERLGWRTRDGLSLKWTKLENDYLHRTLSVPPSADIYVTPPENLTRSDIVLGKGEHGIVFKGVATGLYGKVDPTVVAIKTLFTSEENSDADMSFVKELDVLARCGHHLNIVNLLGVVTTGRPSLLIEYCQYGSLLSYLREHRPPFFFNHVSSEGELLQFDKVEYEKESNRLYPKLRTETSDQALLSTKDLINFSYQIARGMEYLASVPIVHRDLAARNVLVDKGKIVKISDFGMARHEGEYVLQDGGIALPIRWMSPLAIQTKTFSQSSDVWSFGVLLWEMFTLGEIPYGDRKIGGNTEMFLQEIIDGLRLPRTQLCPNDVYEMMKGCWVTDANMPCLTFGELRNKLDALIAQEVSEYYTDLDAPYQKFNREYAHRRLSTKEYKPENITNSEARNENQLMHDPEAIATG